MITTQLSERILLSSIFIALISSVTALYACGACSCDVDGSVYCRARALMEFPHIDEEILASASFISLRNNFITHINNESIQLLKAAKVVVDARQQLNNISCVQVPVGITHRVQVSAICAHYRRK